MQYLQMYLLDALCIIRGNGNTIFEYRAISPPPFPPSEMQVIFFLWAACIALIILAD